MWGIELLVMGAMIAVNSVFAGYEIALASVGAGRLQRLVDEGRRGAKIALHMKQNIEASLAVVQLGITLVGVIAAAVGGAGAEETMAPGLEASLGVSEDVSEILAIALVVLPLTVVTIIFGELIPKVFALRNAERVTLALSPVMRWFSLSVWPAVRLFESIVMGVMALGQGRTVAEAAKETAALQDLRASAALARASRLIGRREEGIILGATALRTRPVREIMLAAEQIRMLAADATLADALIAAHLDMHTRFPVVERPGDVQSAAGYVNVKDIIAVMHLSPEEPSLRAIVRPLLSFEAERSIADCLEQLMHQHTHIALVRDAGGRVVGMVSLEDIIEELVGDIEDEYDRLPAHLVGSGPSWVAGGGVSLERLKATTGLDLEADAPAPGARTLSGWVAGHLGRAVRGGDVIARPSVRIAVRKVRRGKVQEAQLTARS
jgi:putative hemolysin